MSEAMLTAPRRDLGQSGVVIAVAAVFALLKAILFLPARLLGWRPAHGQGRHAAAA